MEDDVIDWRANERRWKLNTFSVESSNKKRQNVWPATGWTVVDLLQEGISTVEKLMRKALKNIKEIQNVKSC